MTGRERNARIKKLAADVLGYRPLVWLGRGTSSRWVTILLDRPLDDERNQRTRIEAALRAEQLCGTYWPDDGTGDEHSCLRFRIGVRIA